MSPPVSFLNTRWGKRNSDFDSASTRSSRSRSRSISPFSYAPSRRRESPPQSRSPSPQRGSIADLRSIRGAGYDKVAKSAREQGFAPPTRESVKRYSARALPPTPTSAVSVDEMTPHSSAPSQGRKPSCPPSPTATILAYEIADSEGRVRAVVARKHHCPAPRNPSILSAHELTDPLDRIHGIATLHRFQHPTPHQLVCAAQLQDLLDSPTLGQGTDAVVIEGRVYFLESAPASAAVTAHTSVADRPFIACSSTCSTVDNFVNAELESEEPPRRMPPRPKWQQRIQKRAEWTLKCMDICRGG